MCIQRKPINKCEKGTKRKKDTPLISVIFNFLICDFEFCVIQFCIFKPKIKNCLFCFKKIPKV